MQNIKSDTDMRDSIADGEKIDTDPHHSNDDSE